MTRQAFRSMIEGELSQMGWPPKSFLWADRSRLVLIVSGNLREVPMHAGMGKAKLNRALGRIEGWADVLLGAA
jgi:hypothetical protein